MFKNFLVLTQQFSQSSSPKSKSWLVFSHRLLSAVMMGIFTLSLPACGPHFQSSVACTSNCSVPNDFASPTTPVVTPPAQPDNSAFWSGVDLNGKVSGGFFDNLPVLSFDQTSKELLVRLPMLANPYIDGLQADFPVAQLPGAHLRAEPIATGGSALALRIPLALLLRGTQTLPPSRLPNGDPLPSVASGEMPSLAISLNAIKAIKATLYLDRNQLGLFVNTPFNPYVALSFPIRNASRMRTWGFISTVPAKSKTVDGGFFISIAFPDALARAIDSHL